MPSSVVDELSITTQKQLTQATQGRWIYSARDFRLLWAGHGEAARPCSPKRCLFALLSYPATGLWDGAIYIQLVFNP